METSAAKFLARIYFSEEQVQEILDANKIVEFNEVSDSSLIRVQEVIPQEVEDITVEDIRGSTFNAKMMIVRDPSRLMVGIAHDQFARGVRGRTVSDIIARYEGIGGVNAGGFVDEGGKGDGSTPLGIVISQGVLKWGTQGGTYEIIGFVKRRTSPRVTSIVRTTRTSGMSVTGGGGTSSSTGNAKQPCREQAHISAAFPSTQRHWIPCLPLKTKTLV
jgi:hypothetical protein